MMSKNEIVFHGNSRKPLPSEAPVIAVVASLRAAAAGTEGLATNMPFFTQPSSPMSSPANIPRSLDIIRYGVIEAIRIANAR